MAALRSGSGELPVRRRPETKHAGKRLSEHCHADPPACASKDAELFAEQIPFVETRDYVRIVQRNAEMYRLLYGLK